MTHDSPSFDQWWLDRLARAPRRVAGEDNRRRGDEPIPAMPDGALKPASATEGADTGCGQAEGGGGLGGGEHGC